MPRRTGTDQPERHPHISGKLVSIPEFPEKSCSGHRMEPEFQVYKALNIVVTRQVWTILRNSLCQHNLALQVLCPTVIPPHRASAPLAPTGQGLWPPGCQVSVQRQGEHMGPSESGHCAGAEERGSVPGTTSQRPHTTTRKPFCMTTGLPGAQT